MVRMTMSPYGKNTAVDRNLSHVVNSPRNLWPVSSQTTTITIIGVY